MDKATIRAYRLKEKGMATKEISEATGIAPGTLRSMFSRDPDPTEKRVCPQCGGSFDAGIWNPTKRFCCAACRRAFWNARRKQEGRPSTEKLTCPVCGGSFLNYGRKGRKYCSRECYRKARWDRD